MQIGRLDHVNVRTSQLAAMVKWYGDILGMPAGFRPKSSSVGAWLYAGDSAVVHLVEVTGDAGFGSESALKLEHFSLSATGGAAFEAKLIAEDIAYEKSEISEINIVQYNVWDPDGNHIHIDFPADE